MPPAVLALTVDLRLPDCHSLKEKRSVVRTVLDGARNRYRVAAAETDHHDRWQRAELGFAGVGGSPSHLTERLDEVERFVWSFPEAEVVETERTWIEGDR